MTWATATPTAERLARPRARYATSASVAAVLAAALASCSTQAPTAAATVSAAVSAAESPTVSPTPTTPTPTTPTPTTPTPSSSTGRATATPAPAATPTVVRGIPDDQWSRILATGTWRTGCPVGRSGLRDVDVPYVGFDGATHRGTLVVNADVAASVASVFARLYRERYPVHGIVPVERYAGDDNASMAADNTSAFNCRRSAQANAPSAASPHANGRAVDLNPYENPWIDPRCGCFQPDVFYGSHRTVGTTPAGRAVIVPGGVAWRAFTQAGWTWQDNSTPDYQHFDTGYPSRPLR